MTPIPTFGPAPLATSVPATSTAPPPTASVTHPVPTGGPLPTVRITLTAGESSSMIGPSQTWLAPNGVQDIGVVVQVPQMLDSRQVQVQFVEPSTMLWKLDRNSADSPNRLAFNLHGSGAGLFTLKVTPGPGDKPFHFSVQVGSDTPPGPTATPASLSTITMDDNFGNFTLHVGQTFLLKIGEGNWEVTVDNPNVLERKKNITVPVAGQGVYQALTPGRTILTAVAAPDQIFQVDVTVVP